MLIKIFTIWVVASQIQILKPSNQGAYCEIFINNRTFAHEVRMNCDSLAEKINEYLENPDKPLYIGGDDEV
jgi:hypothetical protein